MDTIVDTAPAAVKPDRDDVKLAMQIGNAVIAVGTARSTACIGHTIGDLKRALEKLGARDDEPLAKLTVGHLGSRSTGYLMLARDLSGGLHLEEMSR